MTIDAVCPTGRPLSGHGWLNQNNPDLPTLRFMCEEELVALTPAPHGMTEQQIREFYGCGDAWFAEWAWIEELPMMGEA